ncbi:MAG: hopanoid biosynthesis associated radical SAM protein HpnJ [Syntrophobacterales bacterium]|nr:hopanoid biosynthesis associated radical SAM protein HpnJ [Syntrophobacterales bacterium]
MKTLLLNPPSFVGFDGGAGARYAATREITAFWYPTWLAYPAGLIEKSRLLDAPSHGISPEETTEIGKAYDFAVIFSSTAGFANDVRLAEMMKAANPGLITAFVGPHVTVLPEESLRVGHSIDFVVRKEFDYAVAEFAGGKKLEEIPGLSFRKNGMVVHNPDRPTLEDLDALPFAVDVYKRDLDFRRYNLPFLKYPYVSFYTSRGCPAQCTFCLWPQTMTGHRLRTRSVGSVTAEVKRAMELFPEAKEIFFDDDTFTWNKKRVIDLCGAFRPLEFTWSCNARVDADYETLREMRAVGCRLLVVGFESGDPAILKNIKKGTTVEQAREFMKNCRRLGFKVHGDFQVGHPGETRESIERTVRFALELDPDTIQVSISHPFPGTRFHNYLLENGYLTSADMADSQGHQLPNIEYPGLERGEIAEAVHDFYSRFYFRPRIIFRIVSGALWDSSDRRRLVQEGKEFLKFRAQSRENIRRLKALP